MPDRDARRTRCAVRMTMPPSSRCTDCSGASCAGGPPERLRRAPVQQQHAPRRALRGVPDPESPVGRAEEQIKEKRREDAHGARPSAWRQPLRAGLRGGSWATRATLIVRKEAALDLAEEVDDLAGRFGKFDARLILIRISPRENIVQKLSLSLSLRLPVPR